MQTEFNPELPTVGGWEDTERDMLEAWMDAECGCQALHAHSDCSRQVVAAYRPKCENGYVVCQNAADWAANLIANRPLDTHRNCGNPIADCWRIIPI